MNLKILTEKQLKVYNIALNSESRKTMINKRTKTSFRKS